MPGTTPHFRIDLAVVRTLLGELERTSDVRVKASRK
jgi:hypothetical protein